MKSTSPLLSRTTAKISFLRCLPCRVFLFLYFHILFLFVLLRVLFLTWHYFSSQIDRHFSAFLVTDMTIEKLQKVATTHVDASVKVRWHGCFSKWGTYWYFSTPLDRQPKELVISSSDEFEDVDLASDDVLFNIVTADIALKRNDGNKF